MSVNATAKGLQVSLDEYRKLHVDGGGACFLDIPSQTVIREGELGKFLAHAQEDTQTRQLLFELVDEGDELLSSSRPLRDKRELPIAEIDRLERAIAELKGKLTSSLTLSPKSKVLIEQLSLPDPDSAPEMYRIYRLGSHRRLGVLWGCEAASGRSVAPDVAVERLRRRVQSGWMMATEQLLWLALFAFPVVLLAVLAWSLWPIQSSPPDKSIPKIADTPPYAPVSTDGVARQFLRVSVDRLKGLPNTIIAWSGRAGFIRCGVAEPVAVAAEERCRFAVVRPGIVRVEWRPTSSESDINGEFVELRFEEDGSVLTPVMPSVTPGRTTDPLKRPPNSPTIPPIQGPAKSPTKGPAEEPTEKPNKGPSEKPNKGPAENPNNGPAKEPDKGQAEQPKKGPAKEPDKGPAEDPAKGTKDPAIHKPSDTPKQPVSPITQEGGLALALLEDVGNQVKLRVQVKDKPTALLEKVEWTIDGKAYKGNPITFSPERARIEITVEGLSDGQLLRVKATLRRSFTLDK